MSQPHTGSRTINEVTERTEAELQTGDALRALLMRSLPELGLKWDVHLPVFLTVPSLARILWLDTVYQKALDVPGHLVEFGSQWGASINVFLLLKMIREPWNVSRRIISFSTFAEGFVSVAQQDGSVVRTGDYSVAAGWKSNLAELLAAHAQRSPVGAENNFEIVEGDVSVTFGQWLEEHPEAIISHAHFDMDVYKPTRDALGLCLSRMPKGAILVFDELNCPAFPGETAAMQEMLGIRGLALRKSAYQPYSAYCIVE